MKRAAALVAVTFASLALLIATRPFEHANAALDRAFGGLPAWTQVEDLYRDPETQETTRGDHPLDSFRVLEAAWARYPTAERIILMGNSQTQTVSLARGESRPTGPETTYTDQIARCYRDSGSQRVFYRLSAGALSYEEMLWYAKYLAIHPGIRPHVLLVQLNYQNFSNGGIRDGMLEMRAAAPSAPAPIPGDRIETAFRDVLGRVPGFSRRDAMKQSFVFLLIRGRSYLLHLNVAGRRSLGGPRVAASRAALIDLAHLCRRAGIRLVLFQAPTNPAVPLYGSEQDDRAYHDFCASVAADYGAGLWDFEHGIPAQAWGMDRNVPDPLHLGREGHRMMARMMLARLEELP